MNKFAQQLTDDIVGMTIYKIACWAKLADTEPPAPAPEHEQEQQPQPAPQQPQPSQAQEPQPYPVNMREMDPRRAAEALNFETSTYDPMIRPDSGDIEKNYMRTVSPVTGLGQSMPQRYADTAMEAASGMNLPRPPYTPNVNNRYFRPNLTQLHDLYDEPYGEGFADDIAQQAKTAPMPPIADNPGTILRRQHNYYPRGFSPYNYPRE